MGAAETLYGSLRSWSDLQRLVDSGEAEGLSLECKAPQAPQLNEGLRAKLAQSLSGFSNTMGGVVLWGVSTTRHSQSGLDVITELTPLGSAEAFSKQLDRAIPMLAVPAVVNHSLKVIPETALGRRGVVALLIPQTTGDPVQSLKDQQFWLRTTDGFTHLPHDTIRRLFAGSQGPLLEPVFDSRIISLDRKTETWTIPILLINQSSAAASPTRVFIRFTNADACESITSKDFVDQSAMNPGRRVFDRTVERPIYRGYRDMVGSFTVVMKKGTHRRRVLKMEIRLFSDRMRAKHWAMTIQLAKHSGFSVRKTDENFIY